MDPERKVLLPSLALAALAFAIGMTVFLATPWFFGLRRGREILSRGKRLFVTERSFAGKTDTWLRALGAVAAVAYAMTMPGRYGPNASAIIWLLFGCPCWLFALVALLGHVAQPERFVEYVTFERDTLTIRGSGGTHVVRYEDITSVEEGPGHVTISTKSTHDVVSLAPHAASDLAAAVWRAKESWRVAADIERASNAERRGPRELRRPPGMGAREWISRLDALAAVSEARGYRGAELDAQELFTILASDQEEPAARAAAARLLSTAKDDALRVRVVDAANAIGDESVRRRVHVAMTPDAEQAAAETEALELEEYAREL